MKIEHIEDLRAGDRVTVGWVGYDAAEVSGVARESGSGGLFLGPLLIRRSGGTEAVGVTLLSAERDERVLPTEPGSVIVNATIRGVPGCMAMLDGTGDWCTPLTINTSYYHDPAHITAWELGKVVPA